MSLSTATASGLEVLTEEWLDDRLCRMLLRSPSLSRPAEVRVILPPAERTAPGPPPVLLMLHGADAQPRDWEAGVGIRARCEELDALVVMPTGGEIGFCSDWLRAERPVRGRIGTTWAARMVPGWERFHMTELLPWVTERYGASDRRVVLGISMGGHGAIAYTARHPGTFSAAAAFSGVLDTLGPGIPSLLAGALLSHRQHRHAIWGSPIIHRERWEAHNPLDLAPRLAGTPLYLARGDGTRHPDDPEMGEMIGRLERIIGPCTDAMARRLEQLEIPATISTAPGVHEWPTWNRELDLAWPFLLDGLGLT